MLWMDEGTTAFRRAIAPLDDADMRAPSILPGWTRGHVVAHVAHNSEGLTRLARWARTGVETPMYPSREARDAQIEQTSHSSAYTLRALFEEGSERLLEEFQSLNGADWMTQVRLGTGRELAAERLPWMRTRELWIHRLDLGTGEGLDSMPVATQLAMLDDVARDVMDRADGESIEVVSSTGESWNLGTGEAEPRVTVAGTPADLLTWLIGRSDGDLLHATDASGAVAVPAAPPWM